MSRVEKAAVQILDSPQWSDRRSGSIDLVTSFKQHISIILTGPTSFKAGPGPGFNLTTLNLREPTGPLPQRICGMLLDLGRTAFSAFRDVGLFLTSARSDARLEALRRESTNCATAFDRLYQEAPQNDPWASSQPQYRYQRRKYDALIRMLPTRAYGQALDLGCGLGLLTERLAHCANHVTGIDVSAVAVHRAADRTRALKNVRVRQGDIMTLGAELDGTFDLVVVADTIYYLPPPILDCALKILAARISKLLAPNGILLVVNHFFPMPNAETRLTLRIHRAFRWSPALKVLAERKRAFFLATLLQPASTPDPSS